MNNILEFDENGDVVGLYTDDVNLYAIGALTEVRRASNVVFDFANQEWLVEISPGFVIARDKSRDRAIQLERELLGPGGKYWRKNERQDI
jgi:hypothetical protein